MHHIAKRVKKGVKKLSLLLAASILAGSIAGCGGSQSAETKKETVTISESDSKAESSAQEETQKTEEEIPVETTESASASDTGSAGAGMVPGYSRENPDPEAPAIDGLTYESTLELLYAEGYHVYFYEGGYTLISIPESGDFLILPQGGTVPGGISEKTAVLEAPVDHIYLAATSAMALFASIDALDTISFSSLDASGWYVDKAREAMERGEILYAGKYSEPDYEKLVNDECRLAIESTMILHTPKVQEMIEMLDIPVFIDRSSYESHPLGRTEWVKLYGVLTGRLPEALAMFEKQNQIINTIETFERSDKKVAFFYISTEGGAVVRNSDDYIAKMIELAGGVYAFENLSDYSNASNVTLSMEEFYSMAGDADYLIYNASIDGALNSVQELIGKNELFADFKAVRENQIWSTDKSLYQATDIVGELINDVHGVLAGESEDTMTFLHKIN